MKVEVKATQTDETPCLSNDMSNDAYQLMVVGRHDYHCITYEYMEPPPQNVLYFEQYFHLL